MESDLLIKHCVPCEGGVLPLSNGKLKTFLAKISGWDLIEEKKITKEFKFKGFGEAMDFVKKVAALAEEENHHPNIHIYYNRVKLDLSTHTISGLSENDFIMAAKIDELKKR